MVNGTVIRFADFELDSLSRELRRNGMQIHLQRQAFEILGLLVSRPGGLITRLEIRDRIWPDEAFGDIDSRLNFQIKNIRFALGDDPDNPIYIATVPKSGYKFIAPVEPASAQQPAEQAARPARVASVLDSLRLRSSQVLLFVLVGVLVVVTFSAVERFWHRGDTNASSVPPYYGRGDSTPAIASVTPIVPESTQRIVITGSGFGIQAPYERLDTPFIAIRNITGQWSAGRITPENADAVTLTVTNWTDSQITVEGFSGAFGRESKKFSAGDEIEVAVWNPQNGAGPSKFRLQVSQGPGSVPASVHPQ